MNYLNELENISKIQTEKLGWPTRKLEAWKYTSLKEVQEAHLLGFAQKQTDLSFDANAAINLIADKNFINLVFVNGSFNAELSDSADLKILNWNDLSTEEQKEVFEKLSQVKDGMQAMSFKNQNSIRILKIKNETSVDKTVHYLHYFTKDFSKFTQSQIDIVFVGEKSKVKFIESYHGSAQSSFVNNQMHIFLKPCAHMSYVCFQNLHETSFQVHRTQVYSQKHAQLESLSVSLGAKIFRHEVVLNLNESHTHNRVYGLYVTDKKQHHDHQTQIHHFKEGGLSEQIYKGILDDESHGVFDGLVYIYPNSQKVNSSQLNNNLLLSSKAEVDTKPQLEIYADDVKASHGSTVGQLNKDELFYLMSRGINKEKALEILSLGFAAEILYKIEDTQTQNWLLEKVVDHLKKKKGLI